MDLDDATFAEKEAAKFNETKHKSLVMHIDKLENMQTILNAEEDLIKCKSEYMTLKSPKWIHLIATLNNCENKCKVIFVTSSKRAEKWSTTRTRRAIFKRSKSRSVSVNLFSPIQELSR